MNAKRKRRTRAETRVQTREYLLAAAAAVFARRGYGSASIEEIAEEAGYSHGAVYSNFAGKTDLFLAVFEDYMAERARELAEAQADLPPDAPLPARARALADQWMERLGRDPQSFALHMEFIAQAGRDPELARRFGTRSAALREAIAGYIDHYRREAGLEILIGSEDLALILRALGIGIAVEALVSPDAVRGGVYSDFVELMIGLLERSAATGGAR
jgi:AcrR family transcriptional regulator